MTNYQDEYIVDAPEAFLTGNPEDTQLTRQLHVMNNTANEWREEFEKQWDEATGGECIPTFIYSFVQNLLDTHSAHLVEREKQLKQVHTMELDAISCMSIEQFVVWRDYRKQRPALDQAIDIVKASSQP